MTALPAAEAVAPVIPTQQLITTQLIALEDIAEDSNNTRKEYDLDALDQLGASMVAQGQLEPARVRPVKAAGRVVPGKWMLVFGHRRLRAAKRTKGAVTHLRCEVVDLADDKVLVQQLGENEHRKNLEALERSNAHQQMKARGMTIEQIAKDTQTSPATVRDSLKLQELAPALKKAWAEGKLDYSQALECAKLPPRVQPGFLAAFFEESKELPTEGDTLTVRAMRVLARRDFLLNLKEAVFPIADAQLVPTAGACTTCSKRTGAQPDMFGHLKEPDLCTDKPCHAAKGEAFLARAEKEGRTVLPAAKAKEAFDKYGNGRGEAHLAYGSGFLPASEKPYLGMKQSKKPARELVDPKQVILAKNPYTDEIVELVAESAVPKPPAAKGQGTRDNPHVKTAAEKRKDRELVITKKTITRILDSMAQLPEIRERGDEFVHLMILGQLRAAQQEFKKQVAKRLGLEFEQGHEAEDVLKEHIQTLRGAELSRVAVFVACCEFSTVGEYNRDTPELLLKAAKLFELNVPQLEKLATAELEAEEKEKADRKAGKKPLEERVNDVAPPIRWTAEGRGVHTGKGIGGHTFRITIDQKGGYTAEYARNNSMTATGSGSHGTPSGTLDEAKMVCLKEQLQWMGKGPKAAAAIASNANGSLIAWGAATTRGIHGRARISKTEYFIKVSGSGYVGGRTNTTGALVQGTKCATILGAQTVCEQEEASRSKKTDAATTKVKAASKNLFKRGAKA